MKIFDNPNKTTGWVCPICGTDNDGPVILAGIDGTEEGKIMRAEQIHLACIELTIMTISGKVYLVQRIK